MRLRAADGGSLLRGEPTAVGLDRDLPDCPGQWRRPVAAWLASFGRMEGSARAGGVSQLPMYVPLRVPYVYRRLIEPDPTPIRLRSAFSGVLNRSFSEKLSC